MKILSLCFMCVSLVSCVTTTTIQVLNNAGEPDKDVQIYLDGVHKGNGEVKDAVSERAFTPAKIELKKQGCKTVKKRAFLNRIWPHFAGSLVLVLGAVTIYEHLPYNFDFVEQNGVINSVVLAMTAAGIGLAGLNPLVYSYPFHCKAIASSQSAETATEKRPDKKNETPAKAPQQAPEKK